MREDGVNTNQFKRTNNDVKVSLRFIRPFYLHDILSFTKHLWSKLYFSANTPPLTSAFFSSFVIKRSKTAIYGTSSKAVRGTLCWLTLVTRERMLFNSFCTIGCDVVMHTFLQLLGYTVRQVLYIINVRFGAWSFYNE